MESGNFDQIDDALLMSFLDDSQVEDDDQYCDSEKLSSVMRSLEAEIADHHHHHHSTTYWKNDDHHHDHDHQYNLTEGYDETSGTSAQQELAAADHSYWADMDMDINVVGGKLFEFDDHRDQMDASGTTSFLELGSDRDYFDHDFDGVSSFEDHDLQHATSYASFWQQP